MSQMRSPTVLAFVEQWSDSVQGSFLCPWVPGCPEVSPLTNTPALYRGIFDNFLSIVFSVEGMVTLVLAFSATLDAVPRPPYRAREGGLQMHIYCNIPTGES